MADKDADVIATRITSLFTSRERNIKNASSFFLFPGSRLVD